MKLSHRMIIIIGFAAVSLRSIVHPLLDRRGLSNDFTDFLFGALLGVGAALVLLGLRMKMRGEQSCAGK